MLSEHSSQKSRSNGFDVTDSYLDSELSPKFDTENPFSVAVYTPPEPSSKWEIESKTTNHSDPHVFCSQKSVPNADVASVVDVGEPTMNAVDRLRAKFHLVDEARAFLAELYCTGFLIFAGESVNAQFVLSQRKTNEFISVTVGWGLVLFFAVLMGGRVSGAHLNPAVSFFQLTQGKISVKRFVLFVVAQNIGAFIGAALTFIVYYDAINAFDEGVRNVTGPAATAQIFATYPAKHLSTFGAVIDQIAATAVLCMGVAAISDRRNRVPPFLQPAFIGCLLAAIGMAFALNAGYAINPARDFAPRLFTLVAGYGWRVFSYRGYKWFWVPIVCPMIGALLGAWGYEIFIGCHIPDDPELTYIHRILDDRNVDGKLGEVHVVEQKPMSEASSNDVPTAYRNM